MVGARWQYIRARTIDRVRPRLRSPVPDHAAAVEQFLRRVIESRPAFSILQVGAFDGITNDPVYAFMAEYPHVRAVLLEPQPSAFAALQSLWKNDSRVTLVAAALAGTCGSRPLYVIGDRFKHLHPFADQLASFSREYLEAECGRYVWRPPAGMIDQIDVPTVDWPALTAVYGRFDLVAIDAEGSDGDIVMGLDLAWQPPDVVLYEHRHIGSKLQAQCVQRLTDAGYAVMQVNKADTMASRIGMPV